MQEAIVRSCLKDPLMYNDLNFCTGCGRHVPDRDCVWQETGEILHAYMDRLRADGSAARWDPLGRLWTGIQRLFG